MDFSFLSSLNTSGVGELQAASQATKKGINEEQFSSVSPPDRKGLLDFMSESAFAMLLHHTPTQYPARAARQWIAPSNVRLRIINGELIQKIQKYSHP